ncbi:MAG: hypothetical protein ACK4IY_06315, partial [Chitinophagales bacterium]
MTGSNRNKRKWIIGTFAGVLVIICITVFVIYRNLNQLLTDALYSNFQNSIISDVYTLSFANLQVNPFAGNIEVSDVRFTPKDSIPDEYAYISGTIQLATDKLMLKNVNIRTLLRNKELVLSSIEIYRPVIELIITGENYVFFPIIKSETEFYSNQKSMGLKVFGLNQFLLADAQLHTWNKKADREFFIEDLRIDIRSLLMDWNTGSSVVTNDFLQLSIGSATGRLRQEPFAQFMFKDLAIEIDSFRMQNFVDTTMFAYHDFQTVISAVDANTKDSIAHLTLDSLHVSYTGKSVELDNVQYKLNIPDAEMQNKFTYQTAHFTGTIQQVKFYGFHFDSLLHSNQILMDSLVVKNMEASIY